MAERLIDEKALREKLYEWCGNHCHNRSGCKFCEVSEIIDIVEEMPTIEAKPVVHCKDCKYSRMYCFGDCEEPVLACCDIDDDGTIYCAESVNEDDYCSKGEKRDAQMDEKENDNGRQKI